VLTASGHLVAISKLRKGDKVLATNTKSGKTSPEPVAAVLVRHDSDLYDLRVATAHGTAVIDTTRSHLFFDAGHHRWVKAAALKYGTRLRTPSGATATTRGGHDPAVTTGWMWDLNIPGGNDHDFYIHAADTAILVHNCGEGGDSEPAIGPAAQDSGIPAGSTADAATSGSRITPGVRGQYFEDGAEPPTCSYCQQNPAEHLDHVIPRSQGGDLSPENLVPACSWCNLSKGARPAPVNPPPGYVGEWPPSFWPARMLDWWGINHGGG
jgi:hypothetical protein